jgi:hypothetical protein
MLTPAVVSPATIEPVKTISNTIPSFQISEEEDLELAELLDSD